MTRHLRIGAAYHGVGGPGQHELWKNPELDPDSGVRIEKYIEWARIAEEGKLDFFFIADSTFITPDSPPHYLNRLEPLTILAAVATATARTQSRRIKEYAKTNGLTLRETVLHFSGFRESPFTGTAQTVADELERWFAEGALDGIILLQNLPSDFRRFTGEVLPLLRARGLFREEYEETTLRGHLGLRVPENRHTVAARSSEASAASA